MKQQLLLVVTLLVSHVCVAEERVDVWPDLAPGETTKLLGEKQPPVANENPPATRVINITRPTFTIHLAPKPNGTGVLILPGGGFGKVVTDKEGSELAERLNGVGVSAFVLSYRTKNGADDPVWARPLQDAQRSLALIRSRANQWGLKPDRIGLLGLSAGGQVAARLLSASGRLTYERIDSTDDTSHRPDFTMLIYPWNIYDNERGDLIEGTSVPKDCPPTFLVHTDDDRSSSLGSVLFYAALKRQGIPAELHVYGNGGHGYGLRPVVGSQISSWPDHAAHWLGTRGFLKN